MNLSNWNPFKFARRKAEEKKTQLQKSPSPSTGLSPSDSTQQLMQQFFRDPFFAGASLFSPSLVENRWFGDFSPSVFQPSVDVVDEAKSLRITAELPGMSEGDIELSVDGNLLTIKGEKRTDASSDENGCYRTERAFGYFQRVIPLPANASTEGIEANFDKGVLTVRVPKPKASPDVSKRIAVTSR